MKKHLISLAIAIGLIATSCQPKVERDLIVSQLFSDHMVLQQQENVNFWGEYTPGEEITISTSWGETASTVSDENGAWKMTLATPEAGGPFSITIKTEDSTINIEDVLIGEVWLASGQSNMEMPLRGWPPNGPILNADQEIAQANDDGLRMLTVTKHFSYAPLDSIRGRWISSSPQVAGDFSATAYFFAKRLRQELNVPIGIIHSSWGGTPAESWVSNGSLAKMADYEKSVNGLVAAGKLMDQWFNAFPEKGMPSTNEEWEGINFEDEEATMQEFDDSQWGTVELPNRFDILGVAEFDGAVWLRKKFDVEDLSSDYVLTIGAVDDMDATFVNGKRVGGLAGPGQHYKTRNMTIPKYLLVKGSNTVSIRAIDTGGPGEINGPIALQNENGIRISLEGIWKTHLIAEMVNGKFRAYGVHTDLSQRPDVPPMSCYSPTVLYNAMINPLVPYNIKGAIWYQGESNVGRDVQYKELFPTMIQDWRQQWDHEFPFYFVQIAPFNYSSAEERGVSQKLRDAQRLTLQTPHTGMVVTLDIGNLTNIHPADKPAVGSRLAGLALANDYGKDIVASGPLFKSTLPEGNRLIVEFEPESLGSGLVASLDGLSEFEIAGDDGVFMPAKASIVDNKIVLSHAGIDAPKFGRYAWRDDSGASLFNKEGLPASSFTTEQ